MIHHHLEPYGFGLRRCRLVDHPKLHPYRLRANRDRLIDYRSDQFAPHENVDDIDLLPDLAELTPHIFAMHMLARDARVDRGRA